MQIAGLNVAVTTGRSLFLLALRSPKHFQTTENRVEGRTLPAFRDLFVVPTNNEAVPFLHRMPRFA